LSAFTIDSTYYEYRERKRSAFLIPGKTQDEDPEERRITIKITILRGSNIFKVGLYTLMNQFQVL
jgi:hypothetical protein